MASYRDTRDRGQASIPVRKSALDSRKLVAAIDFGTTFSGYAFQTREDFLKNPLKKIHLNDWSKQGSNDSYKTPSCVLFNENQEFDSFGHEAEIKYNKLASDDMDSTSKWYFFKNFKMMLYHTEELARITELSDDKYKTMPAMEVFTHAIGYLKKHLLDAVKSAGIGTKERDIHWVITVPAIWSDTAKRFMREAAINAGIHTDKMSLGLEPEAASLFCRYMPVQRLQTTDAGIGSFGIGDKYMIIDAGGGTVDMTIHKVLEDSSLEELDKATGGDMGGLKVDEAFQTLLNDVYGFDVMEIVQMRYREDYLAIKQSFEVQKRNITPSTQGKQRFQIPASVGNLYKEMNGVEITDATNFPEHLKGKITVKKDKLFVDSDIIKGFFEEVCHQIGVIAKEFYDVRTEGGVPNVLMVGGFSESKMLQGKIRELFPRVRLVIPEDAGMAVVKGAVLFGHNPSMITSRVCKYTYGIKAFKHFEPGFDPPEKKVVCDNNIILCKDAFSKHAEIGQQFKTDETVCTQEYVPSEKGTSELDVCVYTSPRKFPQYVDEENCKKIGEVRVLLKNDKGEQGPVSIEFSFGMEELKVNIIESKTNKKTEANFELL